MNFPFIYIINDRHIPYHSVIGEILGHQIGPASNITNATLKRAWVEVILEWVTSWEVKSPLEQQKK